tara:strand:+ start:210 stop:488 length:279 start_codon:yes stop_codon:yes gene_type:complete
MTLEQAIKIQSILDKRAISSDTLEFLDHLRFSESKKCLIRLGDMHLDHFFRVVANIIPNDFEKTTDKIPLTENQMFRFVKEKIKDQFLKEFK